ncbi:hypothetical protein HWV62_8847 [Athelia sp. TMB]|nr:hypothetical protein HWV62_8847 [Athelia sp. TMB]
MNHKQRDNVRETHGKPDIRSEGSDQHDIISDRSSLTAVDSDDERSNPTVNSASNNVQDNVIRTGNSEDTVAATMQSIHSVEVIRSPVSTEPGSSGNISTGRRFTMKQELAIHERKSFIHSVYMTSRRVESLANTADVDRLIYAVDMLPPHLVWGRRVPCGLDSQRLITLGNSNEPISVWMVGRISQIWLKPSRPSNRPISIYIVPATDGAVQASMDEIQFSRFMPIDRDSGEREQFNGCYDATEFYDKDLLAMSHLPTNELNKLDFVLVSAKIRRFRNAEKVDDQDKTVGRTSNSWTTWKAVFELQTIGLLKRHTAEVRVIRDDPDEYENRYV